MNRSDAWLKTKANFSQQLEIFKADKLDDEVIVEQLKLLSEENADIDDPCHKELEGLIISASLSERLTEKLLSSITDQKTRFYQTSPSAISILDNNSEISNEGNPSSLLKNLLTPVNESLPTSIKAGQTIRSTYYTESKIGSGGMGDVWKALDLIQDAGESKDKYVAIKFINQEIRSHPYALKALVREFARYKKLIHPNIVKAYELNRDGNEVFIAMEYLEGTTLSAFIKKHPAGISLEQAQPIIKSVCDALDYAHNEGIVHLDFKPGNVFYNPESKVCKVIDFGIARLTDPDERDKTRFDPGTLGAMTTVYASCEMLMELEPDPRDDVYGLACVIYELLSGRHPFDKTTALRAEREKKVAKPIKGLSKEEFQAIQRALVFNKENRTVSAQKLYSELFEPQKVVRKKWIKWASIAGLLMVSSFAIYKGYNQWQLTDVKTTIEDESQSGIKSFISLSIDEQKELLLEPALRLALVKDVSNTNSEEEILKLIGQFEEYAQQQLFADRNVRKYLIDAYDSKIEQAIKEDEFQQADVLSQSILQQYSDSIQLVAVVEKIKQQKIAKQITLRQHYQQCLADKNQTLIMLFPCLKETREALRKIDSSERLLFPIDSGLSARYIEETSLAIEQNEIEIAETLIFNWQELEKDEITSRITLVEKLDFANKVDQQVKQIKGSDNTQLTGVLMNFVEEEKSLKQQVLNDAPVKQRIIDYYQETITQLLDANKYQIATQTVSKGIELFTNNKKQLKELKKLDKKIINSKASYLANLEKRYKQELLVKEPSVQVIQTIQADILAVDPDDSISKLSKLLENYVKKIDKAIIAEQFDLADRLFNSWKQLKPSDASNKIFIELTNKKLGLLQIFQNRSVFTEKLKQALDGNKLDQVTAVIKELKIQLPKKEHKKIIKADKDSLVSFYQQHIDEAIKQDKFDLAVNVFTEMKVVFPKDRSVLKNKKTISKAKGLRIKELLASSQQAMESDILDSAVIFSGLHTINIIDSAYFNTQFGIFKNLKKILIKSLNKESSTVQIQDVLEQWDSFISNAKQMPQSARELLGKTKNMIALRCLFNGRKLKAQNKMAEANKLFMFGLSLEPVNSVKIALEEELF